MTRVPTILQFTKMHVTWFLLLAMLVGIGLGLLWPSEVKVLKPWVKPASFLMIYPMMINLNLGDLSGTLTRLRETGGAVIFHFLISLLLLFVILKFTIPAHPDMARGLMLIAIMPASEMAAAWTGFANGNVALVLVIVLVTFVAALAAVPLGASLVIGQFVPIPLETVVETVLLLLVTPFVLGYFTRIALIRWRGSEEYLAIKPNLSAFSSLGLLLIIFIAYALKGHQIVAQPCLVIVAIAPMPIYYVISFVLATGLSLLLKETPEGALALVHGSIGKNRSMATAIALVALSPEAVVAIAVAGIGAQIPSMVAYLKLGVPWLSFRPVPAKPQKTPFS